EQQTATSEILRVISRSPIDLKPVLDAVTESAARLCDATDANVFRVEGDSLRLVAGHGPIPRMPASETLPLRRDIMSARAVIDRSVIHIANILAEPDVEFAGSKAYARQLGYRTALAVPMLREAEAIGTILIRRTEVRSFTDKQIDLLKTFADQAVIAIENVRLFQELQARTQELARSVEQLRSLSQVSQSVNSTLELEAVLETIVARAVQLSAGDVGVLYEFDEGSGTLNPRASIGYPSDLADKLWVEPLLLEESIIGRAARVKGPIQLPDIAADQLYTGRVREAVERAVFRRARAVPLFREDRLLGGLAVGRKMVGEFPAEIMDVLQTFAAHSTLAIQNARLFRELEQKSRELEAASRHK